MTLYIQLAENGHMRKFSHQPFDGAVKYVPVGEDAVERVARAICAADPDVRWGDADGVVMQRVDSLWQDYVSAARAALAAIKKARANE